MSPGVRWRAPRVDERARASYERLRDPGAQDARAGTAVLAVYTDDFAEGRGDVFVAAGLAKHLVRRGWRVHLLPRSRWAEVPPADLVVAMLPTFDPGVVPDGTPVVAWVRNETENWAQNPLLPLYDMVLSSSALSLERLRERYDGPTGLLPIAVDEELFREAPGDAARQDVVVATVNHWGRDRDVHVAMAGMDPRTPLVAYGEVRTQRRAVRRWYRGSVSYFALPDAYRRASLVLDDLNHTTLPYGSVNSRVFEALCAGALPVTNGTLGLRDLGLDGLPVYRDPVGLRRRIDELLADPEGTRRRAAGLRRVVLERHTWAHRADALLALLPQARERAARRTPTLTFWPDYRVTNPFQDLLYGAARTSGVRVVPTTDLLERPLQRDDGGRLDHQVLHVHWTSPLLQPAPGPYEAVRRLDALRARLDDLQGRGGRLVWTVHNVLPHECRYRSVEVELARTLAERADVVHVLGQRTAEVVAPLYRLRPETTRVVPHSSYVGAYPDVVGRAEARRRFRLHEHEVALVVLGGIRPYKGLDRFLGLFDRLSDDDARLRLLVAGKPGRFPGVDEWKRRCAAHPRIEARFEHLDDAELQVWCRAADLAVLPYAGILNSGAYQLALSFGLPLVAPRDGNLVDLLDPAYCRSFDPASDAELDAAVRRAVQELRTPEARAAAEAAGRAYPPAAMARDFHALLAPGWSDGHSRSLG